MKYLRIAAFLLFALAPAAAPAQDCSATKDLPNFGCVNSNLFRGAQPTEDGIKELAKRGVKTIIYLRDTDKNSDAEAQWAKNAGIKFINVPLGNWFAPKDETMEQILSRINTSGNQPVFLHCKRGADRTGTVIAAYRISHDGWTAEQAKAEAKRFNMGWYQFWMRKYIDDYYRKHHFAGPDKSSLNYNGFAYKVG
jgi:tyrosine-protein phosphatase SIW14